MTPTLVVELGRHALEVALMVAAPLFIAALVTGLILMGAEYHGGLTALTYRITMPVAYWMGGLATVRFIHHLLTWLFILFIMVHVYMAVWHDVVLKHAIISSMVSGWVYRKRPAFTPGRRE